MSCCGSAKWKREHIQDHKFDLINIDDFTEDTLLMRLKWWWVFVLVFKTILVYMADLAVICLLIYSAIDRSCADVSASGGVFASVADGREKKCTKDDSSTVFQALQINGEVRFFLIMATVVISYALMMHEYIKASKIRKSGDISYAYTNTFAYRMYVVQSFPHFCFFQKINNSRTLVDELAFYVFFTFRGWKRFLLAEFPRQFLQFMFIFDLFRATINEPPPNFCQLDQFGNTIFNGTECARREKISFMEAGDHLYIRQDPGNVATLWLTTLTVSLVAITALSLVIAFFVYIPLLFNIRGNLKEYCCHKVDKRIEEILRKKLRKRAEKARKAEQAALKRAKGGNGKDLKKYKNAEGAPTLPNVGLPEPQYAYYEDAASAYEPGYDYEAQPQMAFYPQGYAPQVPNSSGMGYAQPQQPAYVDYEYSDGGSVYADSVVGRYDDAPGYGRYPAAGGARGPYVPPPPSNADSSYRGYR
ncbi:hypothetical protein BC832DRAFT_561929 [Gaertneriomyces semiglobifer]|nr:hypothetical protein BC832DRAFT_561929 [Gaertneriomyces semiglobifer]